ncbi:MAG: ABC transporter substrate-binding protein [Thermodesulfobacteriota bacterium]|nr:ABC transporter substrate-binding protein [Thermodesulfobacteriota bacterium]
MTKQLRLFIIPGFFVFLFAVIILFGITSKGYCGKVRGVTKDMIRMGGIFDLTGPAANYYIPMKKGLRSLLQFINDNGGINGRTLKMQIEDDRYSIPMAISAFKKLVFRDGIISLMGASGTGGAVALLKSIEKEKLTTFPPSTAESMVKPFRRYIFTIQDIYPNQMKVIIDYIVRDLKAQGKKIAFVFPDNESGRSDLVPGVERLKHYHMEPIAKEVINPGSIEATSQVMNLKRIKADYIVLCGAISQTTIVLLRELKKFGLTVPVFASWAACNEDVIRISGDASSSYYAVSSMSSWYDEGPGIEKMREITLKYEPGTEKPFRGKTYTYGWVLATVMLEGIKRAGKDIDGESLVESIETMKSYDTGGLTGPIRFSSTNHKGGSTWKIFKANPSNGQFIPMTDWRNPE